MITENISKEVRFITSDIYSRFNASSAIGYLFCVNNNKIVRGMFCHRIREINKEEWDYFYDYKTLRIKEL